jgi:hypothetical protein
MILLPCFDLLELGGGYSFTPQGPELGGIVSIFNGYTAIIRS